MSTAPALAAVRPDDPASVPVELLDQLPLLASYVDRDLVYRFVNRAYERWYGVSRSQILGRTIGTLAGPETLAAARPYIEAALGGETIVFDTEVRSATGPRPARVTYTPRLDSGGEVIGIYTLLEDLTTKREADAAIGAALDGLADGYVAIDAQWRVTAINAAAERFYGVFREEVLGRAIDEIWPGVMDGASAALIRETMATGTATRRELPSSGRPDRVIQFDAVPLAAGGVGLVLHDLTERRALEAALAAKRELLHSVIETSPDPIFAKHLDGTFRIANRATALALGAEGQDLTGRRDRDFLAPAIADAIEANDARAFAGETLVVEEVVEDLGVASRTYLVTKAPLRDPGGAIVGLIGTARDISDRKDGERHRDLLVAELNHRVKNTLAIVQSVAHQTFRSSVDPVAARGQFDKRLQALAAAHDLLTRNGWDAFQLDELLARALEPFRLRRFDLSGPSVRLEARIAVALALALHELATNAVKYGALSNEAGRVALDWHLVSRAGGARLRLTWRETGGPPVEKPSGRGFGSRLIERGLGRELGGDVALEFAPSGVICRIEMPLPY
jgi:PAS domain S-box-containing protein